MPTLEESLIKFPYNPEEYIQFIFGKYEPPLKSRMWYQQKQNLLLEKYEFIMPYPVMNIELSAPIFEEVDRDCERQERRYRWSPPPPPRHTQSRRKCIRPTGGSHRYCKRKG